MDSQSLIVIGGGAAGLFCAVNAAELNPKLKITVVEKSGRLLNKVRISGGGRCNVTHACYNIPEMVRNYPRGQSFLKHSFLQFFTSDTINWFRKRGVQLKTESDGRMFPETDNSDTIINCLLREASKYKISFLLNSPVVRVTNFKDNLVNQFIIDTKGKGILKADFVCIASGGFHKSDQYDWLRSLGHQIVHPVPSLFTFNVPDSGMKELMGISVNQTKIKIQGIPYSYEGPLLITHWGFSGPAILKLSAFAARELATLNYEFDISINWLANTNESALLVSMKGFREKYPVKKIWSRNPFNLPARLWEHILGVSEIRQEWNWSDLPAKQLNRLVKNICGMEFRVKGKTTFKEEFVTAGGIDLNEIFPETMESKLFPGLFFAGEIMDVDGITGGFNFQHAWTSGFIAGKSIAARTIH